MPRKLKTLQTSLGFYNLAIAAQSMKAALEAWGAGSSIRASPRKPTIPLCPMARPGVVLKRPAGSNGAFAEQSDLPTDLGVEKRRAKKRLTRRRSAALAQDQRTRMRAEPPRSSSAKRSAATHRAEGKKRYARRNAPSGSARRRMLGQRAGRGAAEARGSSEVSLWQREKQKLSEALRLARD
jgi:colicin import membrane protein